MRQLPPLTAIRAFEAAGRHQSFTAAASELGLTQAAVSYQVKALEDRLGALLFVREKGRVRLTALGSRLLPSLSQALDTIEATFASHKADDESLLTVTTTYTFANTWLAWRLGAFQLEHPDLAVRLATSDALADFGNAEVDIAIRAGRGEWPGLERHELFRTEITPMASPGFIAAEEVRLKRGLEPADLAYAQRISPNDSWWQKWFSDNGIAEDEKMLGRRGVRLDNQANEGHAAMAGQGFALLAPLLWKGDIAAGRLVQPFPDRVSTTDLTYWLVYPPERRKIPKIKRFREWLLAELERATREQGN